MGHRSVTVTERYAHVRADTFTAADLGRVAVDFSAPVGKILPLKRTESGATVDTLSTVANEAEA